MIDTKLVVRNGKVHCPVCDKTDLIHTYECTFQTTGLRVDESNSPHTEIVAFGHEPDECHDEKVVCLNCFWQECPCGIEVD